jgi:ParB-like chromosome segregation protein Spo0J
MNALTPEQEEMVEQELVEYFAFTQDEVAVELGLQRQSDGAWSDDAADRIMAEIRRQKLPLLTARFSSATRA